MFFSTYTAQLVAGARWVLYEGDSKKTSAEVLGNVWHWVRDERAGSELKSCIQEAKFCLWYLVSIVKIAFIRNEWDR